MGRRRTDSKQFHELNSGDYFVDINHITSEKLLLEAVRVTEIQKDDFTDRELQARYEDLSEAKYKWDIIIHGAFTADRRLARLRAKIKDVRLLFPDMDNQGFLLLPSSAEFVRLGHKIENSHQEGPFNTVGDEMRFEMWRHLHRFTLIDQSGQQKIPDEAFWRACRDFLGYRRIYNEPYKKMEMVLRIDVSGIGVQEPVILYWHSEWDAGKYIFEKQPLSDSNGRTKRFVYKTETHWIDGGRK